MHLAFQLTADSRRYVSNVFHWAKEKMISQTVTHYLSAPDDYVAENDESFSPQAKVEAIGWVEADDGLEILVLSVDGEMVRPDGGIYHLMLCSNSTEKNLYNSNLLIDEIDFEKYFEKYGFMPLNPCDRIALNVEPRLIA